MPKSLLVDAWLEAVSRRTKEMPRVSGTSCEFPSRQTPSCVSTPFTKLINGPLLVGHLVNPCGLKTHQVVNV